MMYGLDTEDIVAIKKVFSNHDKIEKAILYGSRAKGNYRNDSDIDLTLKGENLTLSQLFAIETELDDLLIPYKIDLSIYHKIENQDLIAHIKRVGIVFYQNETLMSEWKEVRLGDNHIDLISGFAFKSKNFLEQQEEGSLPVIKIKNVANGDVNLEKVVYHQYDESLSKFKLSKGDVLIAMTGNHPSAMTQVVGDVSKYKLNVESLLNQRVGKIITKGGNDLSFFYYFFKDKDTHRYLANQSSGSANQANISKVNILNIETEIPEPAEQKAIASVLSSLDDKIDLLHRQNKTLEAIAETLFREWFVEGAEEDWEEKPLSYFGDIICGKTPSKKKSEYFNGEYPFIKIPDMHGKTFVFATQDSLSQEGFNSQLNKALPEKSINVSCIATVGLVTMNAYPSQTNQQINSIIPKDKYRYYLYCEMRTSYDLLHSMASGGTATLNLNTGNFSKIIISNPDEKILDRFNETVIPMFDKIFKNQTQIDILENLRNTLLPKLMSGEIRIPTNG